MDFISCCYLSKLVNVKRLFTITITFRISIILRSHTDNPPEWTTENDMDIDDEKTIPRIRFKMGESLRYGKKTQK